MKNDWENSEAKKFIKKYKNLGFSKDVALRVYTSRLLGKNKELVLHGGGNTSVKTRIKDIDGNNYEVLCVKGSGWDMADIEPEGLPAVKLEPLLAMKKKKYLSDEDMVSFQKRNLIKRLKKRKPWEPIIVSDNLSWPEFSRLNLFLHEIQGIKPVVGMARKYLEDSSSSHIIGYVSDTSVKDLENSEFLREIQIFYIRLLILLNIL